MAGAHPGNSAAPSAGALPTWVLISLAALGSCGGEPPSTGANRDAGGELDSPQPARESRGTPDIDALRALGYAGASEEEYAAEDLGVGLYVEGKVAPGYNLYSNSRQCTAVLMDNRGRVLNSWDRKGDTSWSNVQLLPGGDLLAIGWDDEAPDLEAIDEDRYLIRLDWKGEEVWRVRMNAHHDLEVTPQGQLAVLGFQTIPGDSFAGPGVLLRDDTVHLLNLETGEELEKRSLARVLESNPLAYEVGAVRPQSVAGVNFVDLFHLNSVEFTRDRELESRHPLYESGNVLVCSRHQNSVFLFRWETSELLWTWGREKLMGPHDATVLENGNVLVFDNGLGRGWSRVIELDPLTGEIQQTFKAKPRKQFYTASRGSSQRLPNGNTLVAESDRGRAFELDAKGQRVWSWVNPSVNKKGNAQTIFHFKRLPLEFVERILEAQ